MTFWTMASVIVVALVVVTIVVLFRDVTVPKKRPRAPRWLLPAPKQVREPDLSMAWQGYDPDEVDVLLDAVAAAYEELYLAAGPSVIARAERRLAERRGIPLPPEPGL